MSRVFRRFMNLVQMESEYTYRFPIMELLLALILLMTFLTSFVPATSSINIGRSPSWNGTLPAQQYSDIFNNTLRWSTISCFAGLMHPLAFIVPILTSISVAGCIEDGTLKTLLSYPTKREWLLESKVLLITVVTALTSILGITFAVVFLLPSGLALGDLSLLMSATVVHIILLVAFGTLVSVVFKRVSVAALGGVAFWYVLQYLFSMGLKDIRALSVFLPLPAAILAIGGQDGTSSALLATEIPIYLVLSVGVAAALFAICFMLFRRLEV
ncbi:MAG: ABC transporter permease subunit [Candidatus Thorarchaeota archaeon]|nr:ABC transporter permease subunit [Candidatus Thorarchaeota archaeon]